MRRREGKKLSPYTVTESQLPIRVNTERQRVYVVCYGEDGNECVIHGVFLEEADAKHYANEALCWYKAIDVDWYKRDGWA